MVFRKCCCIDCCSTKTHYTVPCLSDDDTLYSHSRFPPERHLCLCVGIRPSLDVWAQTCPCMLSCWTGVSRQWLLWDACLYNDGCCLMACIVRSTSVGYLCIAVCITGQLFSLASAASFGNQTSRSLVPIPLQHFHPRYQFIQNWVQPTPCPNLGFGEGFCLLGV